MPITDTKCRNAKAVGRPYKLSDAKGLHLEVRPTGAKLWRYRYRIAGKENLFALGEYAAVPAGETGAEAQHRRDGRRFTLEEARQERSRARALVKQGLHPSHVRSAQKRDRLEANENTFEFVAKEWLAVKKPGWSAGRAKQVEGVLTRRIFPHVGNLPIDSITARQMLHVVKKIVDDGAPTIAHLAWNTSAKIFAAAKKTGRLTASPISDLSDVIPRPTVQHHKPLERRDIPKLVKGIGAYEGERTTAIALGLLMLTFVRPQELRGAEWGEFDLAAAQWRIPGARMKMRDPHIVPLSTHALTLLHELHALTGSHRYLFPNHRRPTSHMAATTLNRALVALGYTGKFTPHGFRATASTMLNELGYRPDIIERQLAHKERNATRASYNQAEYLDPRQEMMQGWADLLDQLAKGDGKVVPGRFQKAA
jgi:integrase